MFSSVRNRRASQLGVPKKVFWGKGNPKMDKAAFDRLERLFHKDVLKDNLAKAGVYCVGYEFLKYSLVERPKGFFTMAGSKSDDDYKSEILRRHQSPLTASCLWFEEQGALTDEDIRDIDNLRKYRNVIAHELLNVLLGTEVQVDEEMLGKLFALLCKIDRWWLLNFEIPPQEDFDGQDIDPIEVRSGQMETLWFLITSVYNFEWPNASPSAEQRQ
jgi:hypothetical protein